MSNITRFLWRGLFVLSVSICLGIFLMPAHAAAQAATGTLLGYVNLDASLVKIIRFGSRHAEVRVDFLNLTNTPHYSNPNGSLGDGNFGRITGIIAQTERVIRFGGRFLF